MLLHALPIEPEATECSKCNSSMTLDGELLECDKCDHKIWSDGSEYEEE